MFPGETRSPGETRHAETLLFGPSATAAGPGEAAGAGRDEEAAFDAELGRNCTSTGSRTCWAAAGWGGSTWRTTGTSAGGAR